LSITIPGPSGWTLRSNNGSAVKVEKNILGFKDAVCLMLLSKNLLFITLGSQRNMYKGMLGKMGLLTIALCTLSSNISAPRQKIEK